MAIHLVRRTPQEPQSAPIVRLSHTTLDNIYVTIRHYGLLFLGDGASLDVARTLGIAIYLVKAKYLEATTVWAQHSSGHNEVETPMSFRQGVSRDQRAADAQIDEEMLALVTQLTNAVTWYMRERGLTRADLAARMGVSPGRVSQILGGGENLTLRTLAALSTALDAHFDIELTALKADDVYTSRDAWDDEAAQN
jgi:antitoxin component HigA of HigAB toxin-antitoxin module